MDGDAAAAEGTQVVLEIFAAHLLRADKFKVGPAGANWGLLKEDSGSSRAPGRYCPPGACTPAPAVTPPRLQGCAAVPLREVQRRRSLRGSWPLEGGKPGASLAMSLTWTAAAGMY